ncbi:unnamed protein product [Clonostachys rosea f. rosea IK726]|uniref:Glucose-methanol-choline oxidoreductase N-terminal domain-containing protein n=2 Tax=Bionectria ochroleuca TaxID=29856 RepID=A0A0B7KCS9_BIOOC|nr:unnamed protein product [Clonostachys rosea f. rosea IK726]
MPQWRLKDLAFFLLLNFVSCLNTSPSGNEPKRNLDSIKSSYDYIIVGGGTSGLVVANRLTEDSDKTVLVVEYGDFANTINVTVPYFTTQDQTPRLYKMTSVPQAHLNNRITNLRIGNVVGGSSTVNGMAWDRGSSIDYDSWEELGNSNWGWKTLIQYFRKSSQFGPPAQEYVDRYGYEWSAGSYGDGPIHAGYPAWQWPAAELMAKAWTDDLGTPALTDGADGRNVGSAWLPMSSDGKEAVRSCAETAYYAPVSHRKNLDLLIRHYGSRIRFHDGVVAGLEIVNRDDAKKSKFISSSQVILAAGTVNTPRILQLSGVGPKQLLDTLNIDVVVDAPGVGANFQDHPSFFVVYEFKNNTAINPDSMNDPDFYDAAWDEYTSNKTGPFSHAWGNRVVFQSVKDLDPEFHSIADSLDDQDPLSFLPSLYSDNPPLLRGFLRQRLTLQSQFRNPEAGVFEYAFGGGVNVVVALQKPLSRGTIFINSTNADPSIPPLIDFNTISNPVDLLLAKRALAKARAFMSAESVALLEPVEVSPGPDIQSDADVESVMRESLMNPSLDHPVGTAAMMPRDLGGVVDMRLRVYGVEGLSVVDASVMPLLPAAHTQATVYAVAEYAADILRGRC